MSLDTAVLGVGRAGVHHLDAYSESEHVRNIYLCDRDQSLIQEVSEEYDIRDAYSELDSLLTEVDLDMISIATPARLHFEHAKRCLEEDVYVLLEKPMVSSIEEADKLHGVLEDSDSSLTVVHNEKITPGFQSLYNNIDSIGEISHVIFNSIKFHSSLITNEDHWVNDLKGGYWGEVLPHRIYKTYEIVGEMEVVDIYTKKVSDKYPWFPADHVTIVLRSETGPVHIHLARKREGNIRECHVYGSEVKATATYEDCTITPYEGEYKLRDQIRNTKEFVSSNRVYIETMDNLLRRGVRRFTGRDWTQKSILDKSHQRFVGEFIDYVRGERGNPVDWEEAYFTLRICDEISEMIEERSE